MKLVLFIGLIAIGLVKSQTMPDCPPAGLHVFAYPGSCQRFIRCIFGNRITENCAPGLAFDTTLGLCNDAANANCNPCQGNAPGDVTFIRDEQYCRNFTMCIGNSFSEMSCSPGLYFNTTTRTCDNAANVDCPSSEGTPTTTTQPPGGTTTQPPGGTTTQPPGVTPPPLEPGTDALCDVNANFDMLASPSSCERYTICACGHPQVRNCPPGLIYDVVSQICNTRAQGQCLSESAPSCPPGTVEQIAHPFDCRYLVLCILGRPTFEACAPGLEVNRNTNKCDFPHVARCTSQSPLTYMQLMSGKLYI